MDDRLLILQTTRQLNLPGLLHTVVARGELAAIRFPPRGRIRIRETDRRGWSDGHASEACLDLPRLTRLPELSPGASDIERLLPPNGLWWLA
jgi:hypothetical protein